MDENLTESQLRQLAANDMLNEWLGECGFSLRNMSDIASSLAILAGKRTTLEEKIIRKELNILVSNYCAILSHVHKALAAELQPQPIALDSLRLLNLRVHVAIGELLKALRHSLNYLEQYFEFDFCARLLDEYRFNDEALETMRLVSGESSGQGNTEALP
jgi:hypothetical protein